MNTLLNSISTPNALEFEQLFTNNHVTDVNNENSTATLRTTSNLSPRELEILHLIAYEYSTKAIAQKLYIAYETVHSHRKNLLRKLGASNAAGLVRVGFERGLICLSRNYSY